MKKYVKCRTAEQFLKDYIKCTKTKVKGQLEIALIEERDGYDDGYYVCSYQNGYSEPLTKKPFLNNDLIKANNICMESICNDLNVLY